jgi:hypothetical protein
VILEAIFVHSHCCGGHWFLVYWGNKGSHSYLLECEKCRDVADVSVFGEGRGMQDDEIISPSCHPGGRWELVWLVANKRYQVVCAECHKPSGVDVEGPKPIQQRYVFPGSLRAGKGGKP